MIEKLTETQLTPAAEAVSSQSSVEIEVGGSARQVDLSNSSVPQQDSVQSSNLHISPEFEAPQPVAPDTILTPGDRWNNTISQKELGVAPKVL